MNEKNYQFLKTNNPELLEQIFLLRSRVWCPIDSNLSENKRQRWVDKDDAESHHWVAIDNESVVCAAKLRILKDYLGLKDAYIFEEYHEMLEQKKVAFLSRLQTDETHRGRGLAKELEEQRFAFSRASGCQFALGIYTKISGENRLKAMKANGGVIGSPVNHITRPTLSLYPVVYQL